MSDDRFAWASLSLHLEGVDAPPGHRKTIRHIEDRRDAHHLTFSCVDRRPLLELPGLRELLAESLARAVAGHQYDLYAYVFMPEHVHLFVRPRHLGSSVADLLQAIKRPMSYRARELLKRAGDPILTTLRMKSADKFQLWQRGPGFDSNLRSWESVTDAISYVHLNPVRRGLVERHWDYPWSSSRQWTHPDLPIGQHEVCVCRRKR